MTFSLPPVTPVTGLAARRSHSQVGWMVAGLVLAAVALSVWTASSINTQYRTSHEIQPTQQTFTDRITHLSISVADGQIEVVGDDNTTTQVATNGVTTSLDPTDVEHHDGGTLALASVCATGIGDCERNYIVHLPHRASVSINLGTGEINLSGISGTVRAHTGNGAVIMADVAGTVDATAGTGPILVRNATGPLALTSADGPVNIESAGGPLTVTDGTGQITADGLRSSTVSATCDNGPVTLRFATAPQRVDVTSGTGTIRVGLPPGSGPYQVHTTTGTGRSVIGVQTDPAASAVIDATSQNGDVDVGYSGT